MLIWLASALRCNPCLSGNDKASYSLPDMLSRTPIAHPSKNVTRWLTSDKAHQHLSLDRHRLRQVRSLSSEPGDTLATAHPIKPFKKLRIITESVGIADVDIYRFKVKQPRKLSIFLNSDVSGALTGSLMDRKGQMLRTTATTGEAGASIWEGKLKKGTYYVRVDTTQILNDAYGYRLYFQQIEKTRPVQDTGGGSDGFSGGGSITPDFLADGDCDCSDFSSQSQAQQYLLPGDPYRLDGDGDGIACESLP
jgi:hypothetical protein